MAGLVLPLSSFPFTAPKIRSLARSYSASLSSTDICPGFFPAPEFLDPPAPPRSPPRPPPPPPPPRFMTVTFFFFASPFLPASPFGDTLTSDRFTAGGSIAVAPPSFSMSARSWPSAPTTAHDASPW